jgi:hypothetical protein
MKAAHEGPGVSAAGRDAAAGRLVASPDKFKVSGGEKKDLLASVSGVRDDVVEKKWGR